jgi:hypothetical protein
MKATIWIYDKNCGDGSNVSRFFLTKAEAYEAARHDEERYCEDINSHTFEFDENGKLINVTEDGRLTVVEDEEEGRIAEEERRIANES